jgi:hypothetical protein
MLFPWVGLFEQVRLADVFVHYDDVQLPTGRSFITRVQVKTADGARWLAAPVRRKGMTPINEVRFDETQPWRKKHLSTLRHCYARAPFFDEMYALAERVYGLETDYLWEFNVAGIEEVSRYLELSPRFVLSSSLGTTSHGTQKLADIATLLHADRYVTGLGALRYLDYEVFEALAIRVEYMNYQTVPYPQLHGPFTPSVTILDCIANCGTEAARIVRSTSRYWKDVVDDG